jgi:hypothetical protein
LLDGVTALNNAVGARAKYLFEFTIDMGAHPNETGIFGRVELTTRDDGQRELRISYLNRGPVAHTATLKTATRTGVCALECFGPIFRERFAIMGLKGIIDGLKTGL